MISEQDNLPGNTQVMDTAGTVNQKVLSGNVARKCLKYWDFNAKLCWLCYHWGTEIRLGYAKGSGPAGKSPPLLEVRASMAEFGTLQGEQALISSPEAPKGGKRFCIIPQQSSSSCFLISHPLLCN